MTRQAPCKAMKVYGAGKAYADGANTWVFY